MQDECEDFLYGPGIYVPKLTEVKWMYKFISI